MQRLIYFLLIGIVLISCEDDKDEIGLNFSGISETGLSGESLSSPDATDWNFNDNWNNIENNLFATGFDDICETSDYQFNIAAYPNPCKDIIYLHIAIPEDKSLSLKIIDEELNILLELEGLNSGVMINIGNLRVKNKIVRAYYKILGENCELRGHGDIQVN